MANIGYQTENMAEDLALSIWDKSRYPNPNMITPVVLEKPMDEVAEAARQIDAADGYLGDFNGFLSYFSRKNLFFTSSASTEPAVTQQGSARLLQIQQASASRRENNVVSQDTLRNLRKTALVVQAQGTIAEVITGLNQEVAHSITIDELMHSRKSALTESQSSALKISIKNAINKATKTYEEHCGMATRHASIEHVSKLRIAAEADKVSEQLSALFNHFDSTHAFSAMGEYSLHTLLIQCFKEEKELMKWLTDPFEYIKKTWKQDPEKEQSIAFSMEARLRATTRARYVEREQFRLALKAMLNGLSQVQEAKLTL